jgi:hypothetical protein
MIRRARTLFVAALLLAAPTVGHAALASYTENFDGMVITDPLALGAAGWLVYGNVFSPAVVYLYGYGPFPAPNGGTAFCALVDNQGGVEQGINQLSVYNDYNNLTAHDAGYLVEANVYREQAIGAGDVGNTWTFSFDAKLGNIVAPSTALAFIKTIDPNNNYATTNFVQANMTAIPATWNRYTLSLPITAGLVGQLFQIGFNSTATNYVASGIFYDNISLTGAPTVGVGDRNPAGGLALAPNSPNPFQRSTRLDYSLPQRGLADVSVYDVTGRRVATLFHGFAEAGPHVTVWDGRFADGRVAPAGIYHGVLQTAAGRVTRSMVLAR